MNRRRLILAGGTVCWATVGAARRRRRPPRDSGNAFPVHAVVTAPAVVALLGHHEYFVDWGGVWGGIWGFLGGITGGIRDFVQEAIEKAVSAVMWFVNTVDQAWKDVTHALGATIGEVVRMSSDALNAVGHVIVETTNRIDGAFQWIRQQVKEAIDAGWAGLVDFVTEKIPGIVKGLLGDAWDIIEALMDLGSDGISFLLNLARDPIGVIWELISDLVQSAIGSAIDAAGFGWDAFWGLFWPAMAQQLGVPEDPLDVLRGAWWLLKLAWKATQGDLQGEAEKLVPEAARWFEDNIRRQIGLERTTIEGWVADAMGVGNATGGAVIT